MIKFIDEPGSGRHYRACYFLFRMFSFNLFDRIAFFYDLPLSLYFRNHVFLPTSQNYFSMGLFFFCIGFVWSAYKAKRIMSWKLPFAETNYPVGRITSLPQKDAFGKYFDFRLIKFNNKK